MTINIFLQVSEEFFSFEDLDKFLSWQRRFRGLPWMRTSLSGPQGGCRGDRRPPLLLSTASQLVRVWGSVCSHLTATSAKHDCKNLSA